MYLVQSPKDWYKGLEDLEIRGRAKTIQTTALLRSARIQRRLLKTCCHSDYSGKPSAKAGTKELSKKVNSKKKTKKLCCRNLIKRINTWSASLVRYSVPFLNWAKKDVRQTDERTMKMMTMHEAIYLRDDVGWFCVSRKGERRLASIEKCVNV